MLQTILFITILPCFHINKTLRKYILHPENLSVHDRTVRKRRLVIQGKSGKSVTYVYKLWNIQFPRYI